jgi:hypothetical protein
LTNATDSFSVGIRDSDGCWPPLPHAWSYSSLHEATECPRRWMLSRAIYADLWTRRGYPPRPSIPALIGDVVHGVLETLLRSFQTNGCKSGADPAVVIVLKSLGGYTKLVERGIEQQVDKLADNPRINDRLGPLKRALQLRVPEIRQRVQTLVARTPFQSAGSGMDSDHLTAGRRAVPEGFHPEIELTAPSLRLAGRLDLLKIEGDACEITDYKTGTPDPHHADQLRFYALLWSRDHDLNPESLPIRRLILSYPTRDVDVDPPTLAEMDDLAASTSIQIEMAESALRERPPPAYPEATMCRLCGVRQLCSDYWNSIEMKTVTGTSGANADWFDFEGTVTRRNGSRSWLLAATGDDGTLLLQTASETVPFNVGDRVRFLNLHHEDDTQSLLPIGRLTHISECYTMTSSISSS